MTSVHNSRVSTKFILLNDKYQEYSLRVAHRGRRMLSAIALLFLVFSPSSGLDTSKKTRRPSFSKFQLNRTTGGVWTDILADPRTSIAKVAVSAVRSYSVYIYIYLVSGERGNKETK